MLRIAEKLDFVTRSTVELRQMKMIDRQIRVFAKWVELFEHHPLTGSSIDATYDYLYPTCFESDSAFWACA